MKKEKTEKIEKSVKPLTLKEYNATLNKSDRIANLKEVKHNLAILKKYGF